MADISALKGIISEEQYNALDTALKDSKAKFADLSGGDYVAKEKFEKELEKAKQLETQVKEANTQIEEFKKLDVEGIKKAADEYKTKYEAQEADFKSQLDKRDFDQAMKESLAAAKVKNVKAVEALLNKEALKFADGKIIGLEEQLKPLQESDGYLFAEAEGEKQPNFGKVPQKTSNTAENDTLRSAFGLE